MTRAGLFLMLIYVAGACSAGGGDTAGCAAVDGAQSALAFLVILAPVLRMLAIKPTEDDARGR